ncbi:MAG: type II toxin-antitoxin system VapC family toxin [Patescibacteria group bacterium]
MNIVDSSAWIEYFADTKNAKNFARVVEESESLIVPSIILYEVFKKVLSERGEDMALRIIAHMKLGKVVDLDLEIALLAARLAKEHKLPMADSVILATAQRHNAIIWTQDSDFKNFKGVKFFNKK